MNLREISKTANASLLVSALVWLLVILMSFLVYDRESRLKERVEKLERAVIHLEKSISPRLRGLASAQTNPHSCRAPSGQ